jgi:hypothetical protein
MESSCKNCVFGITFQHGKELIVLCTNSTEKPGELVEIRPVPACKNHKATAVAAFRLDPPRPPNDEIRYIALTKGKFAIVDAADFEWAKKFKWFTSGPEKYPYAIRAIYPGGGRKIALYLHRAIMKPSDGLVVDHRNGNTLDNRRANLRLATKRQNTCNMRVNKEGCSSRFRGVSWNKCAKKWQARISFEMKRIYLGLYGTEVEAAKAYDEAAKIYNGEFARLNFPETRTDTEFF